MGGKCYVYRHIFPNGKMYIGISNDPIARWKNGRGYDTQPKMKRAIAKYGWDNIKHQILFECVDEYNAGKAEELLISAYDTVTNGYNVSIGGAQGNSTYLDNRLLAMCCAVRRYDRRLYNNSIAELAYNDRYDHDSAEFWNEAYCAVTNKHGLYSDTDEVDVSEFWYYMSQYFTLYVKILKGEDVTNWEETPVERARLDYIFGKQKEGAAEKNDRR